MQIIYSDGADIRLAGDVTAEGTSDYIAKYIETGTQLSAQRAWKNSGYGARFRGETAELPEEQRIDAFINSVNLTAPNQAFYTFSVNEVSGLYKKDFAAEKYPEAHVVHARNIEFLASSTNAAGECAVAVRTDGLTGHIAELDLSSGDWRLLTGGDCYDNNPSFSRKNPDRILYDSAGVGRDYAGNFVAYADRSLFYIDRATRNVDEILKKDGKSLIKPKEDADGNLYFIEKPTKYKTKKSNLFLDILLIPVKILVAIYRFLETFVMMFTGKTFTSHDANPTKGREQNSRQIVIDGNRINVDKEYKRNCKNADKECGIVPAGWQLTVRRPDGSETVLKKGVTAYDLTDEGIVYTNGKRVYLLDKTGKTQKLAEGKLILQVAVLPDPSAAPSKHDDIFG
ncbi:MAG: hypothetical protein HFK10_01095 [Clostridia bacterium]|nr:hypothetical protein [Clostridia bacterium]